MYGIVSMPIGEYMPAVFGAYVGIIVVRGDVLLGG